jgi:hypothetical protein
MTKYELIKLKSAGTRVGRAGGLIYRERTFSITKETPTGRFVELPDDDVGDHEINKLAKVNRNVQWVGELGKRLVAYTDQTGRPVWALNAVE